MSFAPKSLKNLVGFACVALFAFSTVAVHARNEGIRAAEQTSDPFAEPLSVRNQTPIDGEEIAILRTFKIEKGAYEEFYKRSVEGVWPYFEKIGARIVGMWLVDQDALDEAPEKAYDEVILLTRYASLDHWRASRDSLKIGGNGPDAKALLDAHAYRQSVTKSTTFLVLRGELARNGPYFMPAVAED